MTRRLALAALVTCPMSQACAPVIYEVASETNGKATDDSTSKPDPDGDDDPGGPGDGPDGPDPTGDGPPPTCSDGFHNGDETDLDCGGPCEPCGPGQLCDGPGDCLLGECLEGLCPKLECTTSQDCPPADACLESMCTQDGRCVVMPADGQPCDDGDACTLKDLCLAGQCIPDTKVDCSAFDGPCRAGICNPNTGSCLVEWLHEGDPCKDDLACTFDDTCSEGECVGKQPPPSLLAVDFTFAGGWKADLPWSIGPAKPSACAGGEAEDPPEDHTPGPDNMLAGAAIGSCLPVGPFPETCLESPPIDLMFMPGPIELRYWSVFSNAGQSRIDLFDDNNQSWKSLVTIDEFVSEKQWTEHVVDLSGFEGSPLRVRFCHSAVAAGKPVGGWSIDDLSVGAPQCP